MFKVVPPLPHLARDFGVVLGSLFLAYLIGSSGSIEASIVAMGEWRLLASFIAGLFFTSFFTATPAMITLAEISQVEPLFLVAVVGGLGAVLGDLFIIRVIKKISRMLHATASVSQRKSALSRSHHARGWWWKFKTLRALMFLVGAVIIASPLPDELGLALMSDSKVDFRKMVAVLFCMNVLGIYCVGVIARMSV